MLLNLIIFDYFLSRRQLRTSKNTKTSFQSSLRFCGKFSEFFFLWNPHFYFYFYYWNTWRDVQKNTCIQPKETSLR